MLLSVCISLSAFLSEQSVTLFTRVILVLFPLFVPDKVLRIISFLKLIRLINLSYMAQLWASYNNVNILIYTFSSVFCNRQKQIKTSLNANNYVTTALWEYRPPPRQVRFGCGFRLLNQRWLPKFNRGIPCANVRLWWILPEERSVSQKYEPHCD